MKLDQNLLILSLFSILTLCINVVAFIPIMNSYYPIERDALLRLRDSVGSSNLYSNWTGPPCRNNQSLWGGIACSEGHVVHLVLDGVSLSGSLPKSSFLQDIILLTKLSLRNNSIVGPLPNLTNLVHLEHVFLSDNLFTGSIPLDYIQLPNLEKIELQRNYLQGEIPPFNQQSLVAFNVSYNSLRGQIPNTTVLQKFPSSSYQHNSDLCGYPLENPCPAPPRPPPVAPTPAPERSKKRLGSRDLALILAASLLLPFLVILVFLWYYKRMQKTETTKTNNAAGWSGASGMRNDKEYSIELAKKRNPASQRAKDPEKRVELEFFDKNIGVFDLDDLLRASAEVLGKGNLGTTYKATMETGLVVAVKRVKNMNGLSKKEFVQQMQLLGKLRHQNLAHIISFYNSKDEKLIIYEFVPHGNLFELLHENRGSGRIPVNWSTRLSIIKDIATAMNFLHHNLSSQKVPHANLKSSNILINRHNQTFHSKISDFGYFPLLPSLKSSEMLAVGRSPEFSKGKKLSHKADVYCFGIILLEIITGRFPGDGGNPAGGGESREEELSEWVREVVNNDWSIDILDVEIVGAREAHDDMLKLTELALECTDLEPEQRPKMSQVLTRIEQIQQRSCEDD